MKNQLLFVLPFNLLLMASFYLLESTNKQEIVTLESTRTTKFQDNNVSSSELVAPVTLIDEDFESGELPSNWTVEVIVDIGINTWAVGTGNSIDPLGTAAVVSSPLNPTVMDNYDSSDADDNSNEIILRTHFIDASSITDLQLDFTWGAGGESDTSNPPLLDYGSLVYSLNGVSYIEIGNPFAGDGVGVLAPATGNFSMSLSFLDGEQFYLGFRWINDQLLAGGASFAIDDVMLTGEAGAFAVDMVAFQAELVDNRSAQLTWETANEDQNKGFDILRSFDGVNFEKIGFMPAKNNKANLYTFKDNDLKKGVHYYHLRQLDNNGKFNDSRMVSVDANGTESIFQIYPNQISESFTVEFDQEMDEKATLQLLDMSGKLMKLIPVSKNILQQHVYLSDLNLAAGTYVLSLQYRGVIYTQTLVKK